MDWLIDYPWNEILLSFTLISGVLAGIFLLISRYPSSRFLGKLVVAWLFLLVSGEVDSIGDIGIGTVITSLVFFLYTRAFFNQKTRINLLYLVPATLAVSVMFFSGNALVNQLIELVIIIGYMAVAIRSIRKEGRVRGIDWFRNPGSRLVWFRNFVLLNILVMCFWLSMPLIETWLLALSILLLQSFIYFQVFRESAFLLPIPVGNKYQKSTLTPTIKSLILGKIDKIFEEEEFYLRDDASLGSLASELGVTTHHLSQVLNESMKTTFQDLVAKYRVRASCKLLRDPGQSGIKIENIAAKVGYNSKSAFNTAFKRRMGMTPSEFREAKDVLSYGEERLPERKSPHSTGSAPHLNHVFSFNSKGNMVSNFFKIFFRSLARNKVFSAINLFGLTTGFTCSILIYLFISHELSYDKSIPDYEQIYRISWQGDNPQTRTPHPMAQAMVKDLPEVETAVSISPWYGPGLSKEKVRVRNVEKNILFEEPDFFFADSTFFEVFSLEVLEGDPEALSKPWSLVISKKMAEKYFGEESAVGKELELNDMPAAVSAVVEGMPENSHFHFNAIIPYVTLKQINPEDTWMKWGDFGHFNYIKLGKGVDPAVLQANIPDWISPYLDWGEDYLERLKSGNVYFELQPIQDIHLTSRLRWELEANGNILYIYILGATLVFILLIISINYVNLTTAKSLERAKEIGIRKTLGAVSGNLSVQFYFESVLFCLAAVILAFGISSMLLEGFNYVSGKSFSATHIINLPFIATGAIISIVIGLLAGVYPAIALSSFRPTEVLKGKQTTNSRGVRLRSLLVILQFAISTILITGSLIILRQIDFMKNKELGFDQEAVIAIDIPVSIELGGIDLQALYAARQQIEAIPGVRGTSMISNLPGGQFNQHPVYVHKDPSNRVDVSEAMVDFGIEEVLGFEIAAGRMFDASYSSDTATLTFVINEIAATQLGLSDPIGEKLVWVGNDEELEGTIIGVLKDFHYKSLHQDIQPLIMVAEPEGAGHLVVKTDGKQFGTILEQIEVIYSDLNKDFPFAYSFLDQQLAELYHQEVRTLSIFSVFSLVALILAGLGLLGMALAIMSQRVKEVGMRKILGASSGRIMQMIFMQFLRLIVVALIVGLPVAFLLMQSWMNEFSYQAGFGIMPFVWSILILVIVALISVSSAVMKISFSNPVDALRYE